jgi:hypothetical protein
MAFNVCPVCGYDKLAELPYNNGNASFEICSCCGFQFGFDDDDGNYSFKSYRDEWINRGFPVFNASKAPAIWNVDILNGQLKNIK